MASRKCCCVTLSCIIFLILGLCSCVIFPLILRPPYIIDSKVTDAVLTEFNFNFNHTLHYNLALNITLQNPNLDYLIHYDKIELLAYYKNQSFGFGFGMANLMDPYDHDQGPNCDALLTSSFKGQHMFNNILGAEELWDFKEAADSNNNYYHIVVKIYVGNNYFFSGVTKFTSWKARSEITCDLKRVPLVSGVQPAVATTFDCKEIDTDTSLTTPFFMSTSSEFLVVAFALFALFIFIYLLVSSLL